MSLSAPLPPARTGIPVALFVVSLLVVAGGAVAATAVYLELRPAPSPSGSLTVTDDLGRTVTVPSNPSRVVALGPNIVDTMVRLGLRERLVGIDCYAPALGGLSADYTAAQIQAWNLTDSMCVQTGPSLDVEEVLNLSAQLVLFSGFVSASTVEEIQTTYRIPVVMLQPATLGGISYDVELAGKIFDEASAAGALVSQMQAILGGVTQAVGNITANGSALPTVLLTYYATPAGSQEPGYWTYGPGTFGESLIELAGASSISANATTPYPELSGSQVLASDPWGIVYGTGFGVNLTSFQEGPDWSSLSAVQAGRVWGLDSTLLTEAGPTMILAGLPDLFAIIHPGSPIG